MRFGIYEQAAFGKQRLRLGESLQPCCGQVLVDCAAQGKRGEPVQQVATNQARTLYEGAEALRLAHRGRHGMDHQYPLRVLLGASRVPSDQQQPTLIVEAEQERVDALRQQLARSHGSSPVLISQSVLGANPDTELTWFHYNDSRMNGVLPPERWQVMYPNIQLDHQETHRAQTLAQVLSEWPDACAGERGIHLTISQGDPIEVISGAGEWLQRIHRIKLDGPHAEMLWLETFNKLLQEHGFRLDKKVALSWDLDPFTAKLIGKQADMDALQQQLRRDLQLSQEREKELSAALHHVFPYPTYRIKRPDLASFQNQELVNHFAFYGIREGVDLQFESAYKEMQELRAQQAECAAKLQLLENKARQTAQQLELLKELFTRLMVTP